MAIMTHAKSHFNQLMLTLIFGIRASEHPPRAWRPTEKAGPDRVKGRNYKTLCKTSLKKIGSHSDDVGSRSPSMDITK